MTENNKQCFVFVVCGAREHIDTLHFSIKALQQFSKKTIYVITDVSRNETPILYDNIINVQTPAEFSHHQASIYLKTGIHLFLPKGNLYCYLDTDVVALSDKVDAVFNHYSSPISFSTDHCKLSAFSPSAIHCGCQEKKEKLLNEMDNFNKIVHQDLQYNNIYTTIAIQEIESIVEQTKQNKLIYMFHKLKYAFGGAYYRLNKDYKLHKKSGIWFDNNNNILQTNNTNFISYIESKTGYVYSTEKSDWITPDNICLLNLKCDHLRDEINTLFGINIANSDWQHWNGGLFLFNDESEQFLDDWHQSTMVVFKNKKWKTRDQGTLAYTAWKNGLENHPTLPKEFNFIADFNNKTPIYKGNCQFFFPNTNEIITPVFIHIYHHWGDKNWAVWNDVCHHTTNK